MNTTVLRKLKELKYNWELKRNLLLIQKNNTIEDITIYIPGANYVKDYGLINDYGIFRYKLPSILVVLWNGTINDCVKLMNDIIDFQKSTIKNGGISEPEIEYSAYIINIIAWVLKHKYGLNRGQVRNITTGNLKAKTHFTI